MPFSVNAELIDKWQRDVFAGVTLSCPEIAACVRPGQFVNVTCQNVHEREDFRPLCWAGNSSPTPEFDKKRMALLPRAFSVMDADVESGCIDLLFGMDGRGAQFLMSHAVGTKISVLGPIGNCFTEVEEYDTALLIAGGVGLAPMPFLAQKLAQRGHNVVVMVGARRIVDVPLQTCRSMEPIVLGAETAIAAFAQLDVPSGVSLDVSHDSFFTGTVVELARKWMGDHPTASPSVYACGPVPMLNAVAEFTADYSLPCQLAMEERMACALGICVGCPVKVRIEEEPGAFRYELCCVAGPVFDGRVVMFK